MIWKSPARPGAGYWLPGRHFWRPAFSKPLCFPWWTLEKSIGLARRRNQIVKGSTPSRFFASGLYVQLAADWSYGCKKAKAKAYAYAGEKGASMALLRWIDNVLERIRVEDGDVALADLDQALIGEF